MPSQHTFSVFSENRVGLLGRVTSIFTRRSINIESLTVSKSELEGVHRFTIVVSVTPDQANKLALQLERQVDVLKAFVHNDGEIIARDLALYKVDATRIDARFEQILVDHRVTVLARNPAYVVVELAASEQATETLLTALTPYGVLEFVRSGRVALTRPVKQLGAFLDEIEIAQQN